jgi:hypothetical protein
MSGNRRELPSPNRNNGQRLALRAGGGSLAARKPQTDPALSRRVGMTAKKVGSV